MPPEITPQILSVIAADYDDWATTLEALASRYNADANGRGLNDATRKAKDHRDKAADLRRCRDAMLLPEEADA